MKVKVSINKLPWNGFLNIDPAPDIPEGYAGIFDVVHADYRNINSLVYDTECEEFVAEDIIDYIPAGNLKNNVLIWINKLRHGGKIVVSGTDIEETVKHYISGKFDIEQLNQELYGYCNMAWHFKNGMTNMKTIIDIFKEEGLKITKKTLSDNKMIVTATRN